VVRREKPREAFLRVDISVFLHVGHPTSTRAGSEAFLLHTRAGSEYLLCRIPNLFKFVGPSQNGAARCSELNEQPKQARCAQEG
jgi:hypothetical protein